MSECQRSSPHVTGRPYGRRPSSTPSPPRSRPEVWAYSVGAPSFDSLAKHYRLLDGVVVAGITVDASGDLDVSGLHWASIRLAKARGLRVHGLVQNLKGGNFSAEVIHKVLTDPSARLRSLENLTAFVYLLELDGMEIDFEFVPAEDRDALTSFVRDLRKRFRGRRRLTQAVPGKTEETTTGFTGAFDYAALGREVDWLAPLAYDFHTPLGPPGPIAPKDWVRDVVAFSLSQVPTDRLVLGVGVYGYEWPLEPVADGRAVDYKALVALLERVDAELIYDVEVGECTARYRADDRPHVLFFQCAPATEWKWALAKSRRLRGVVLWRLGQEEPATWDVFAGRGVGVRRP